MEKLDPKNYHVTYCKTQYHVIRTLQDNPTRTIVYSGLERFVPIEYEHLIKGSRKNYCVILRQPPVEKEVEVSPDLQEKWDNVPQSDKVFYISKAMTNFGGSFVQALGDALRKADPDNRHKILTTWPEYINDYSQIAIKAYKDKFDR